MAAVLDVEEIERETVTLAVPALVEYLQQHLGGTTVAYIAGQADTQMLARWKKGSADPQSEVKRRLRTGYHVTRMIVEAFDDATAEAWLFGSNTKLDDEAPAYLIRRAKTVDDLRLIVPAAKALARAPE